MKVKVPAELYDNIQGVSADALTVFPITDEELEEASAAGAKSANIFSSRSALKTLKITDDTNSNKAQMLSMSGGKLESTNAREFLMAGYFKSGQTINMYLGTSQSQSTAKGKTDPDEITSSDAIVNALDNAVSSDAILGDDILTALGTAGMAAYGIDDDTDLGNPEDGYKYVLISLDTGTVSSGDIVYVNLLSGDSYSSARSNAANALSGYFTLKLFNNVSEIHWLLINISDLKDLDDDSALSVEKDYYLILARVEEFNGSSVFKAAAITGIYSTNDVTLLAASGTNEPVTGSSKSSSSGCNAGAGIFAAALLVIYLAQRRTA